MTDLTERDFSKMSTREILEWKYKNITPPGVEMELVGICKQELAELKEGISAYRRIVCELKADCKTLAQTLLKVSPEHREWLETNFKEYL